MVAIFKLELVFNTELKVMKNKLIITTMIYVFSITLGYSQAYFGVGVTKTWSSNFGKEDINFSYLNPDNLPMTNSWIENNSYNFLTLLAGYKINNEKFFHDLRVTLTSKGAISLFNKQDFLFDPIVIDLQAYDVLGPTNSKYIEMGVYNKSIGIRYGIGKKIKKYFYPSFFIQSDIAYKKIFTINWYNNPDVGKNDYYSINTYGIKSFTKEENVAKYISNINLELGFSTQFIFQKYFGLNLEIAHSLLPYTKKGSNPNILNYTYWEKNTYISSLQLSLITFIDSN